MYLSYTQTGKALTVPGLLAIMAFILPAISLSIARAASELPFPLEPPDTSSPRATLESFMRSTSEGARAYRAGEDRAKILPWFERANRCLDLSHISPDRLDTAATEAGLLLYEVINRAGVPAFEQIPDIADVQDKGLTSWAVPRTQIVLSRVEEGDRKGEFLFSTRSVDQALAYYESVKDLPHNSEYLKGTYEEYVTRPDFSVPYHWADTLPAWANERILRNPVWKHLALVVIFVLGFLAAWLIRRLGRGWDQRYEQFGGKWGIGTLVFSISLVIIPLVMAHVLNHIIGVRFGVQAVVSKLLLAHPKVAPEPLFVRFMGFGACSLDVELFANTTASNWLEYRAIREDINFRIMDIVKESGTGFAFPSQTSYFTRDPGLDAELAREAEEQVDSWRSRGKLPFPEFEQEEQEQLEDTIEYPPKGSPDYRPRVR